MDLRTPIVALLLLAALSGQAVSAAGTGTFTLSDAAAPVGQNGVTTLVLNATWDPPAADIWLNVRYDPDVIRYERTRFLVGGTVTSTRTQAGTILVQLVDPAGEYRSGPLAEFTFSGLQNGSSPLEIELQHVRSYPDGRPVEITDSAATAPGQFTVTLPPAPNGTAAPTEMPNVTPSGTPASTPPATVRPTLPTLPPTFGTAAPATTVRYGDDYTGAVSPTATVSPAGTAPASNRTIGELVGANPDFSVFANATRTAGLFEVLESRGPLTAFVPTDAAFAALPAGALEDLFGNRTALEALVRYHLAPETLTVADVTARASVPTLLGVPLRIGVRPGGAVGIDGANLTLLDIPARNGMVHIVDGVLVPPDLGLLTPTPTPSTMATPSRQPTTTGPTTRAGTGAALVAIGAFAVVVLLRHRVR